MSYTGVSLPLIPSGGDAQGLGTNGTIVVGGAKDSSFHYKAVYWDGSNAIHSLPGLTSGKGIPPGDLAYACSADGTIIVGQSIDNSNNIHAVTWTGGPSWAVNDLGFLPGGTVSQAFGCSSDGSVVVGTSSATGTSGNLVPCVWINGVIAALPLLSSDVQGAATACSSDGTILAGNSIFIFGSSRAVRWTGGPSWVATQATTPGGYVGSSILAANANAGVIAGWAASSPGNSPFATSWSNTTPTVLSDPLAGINSEIFGSNANGTVLCGVSTGGSAVVFISGTGSLLPIPSGLTGTIQANAVSSDGSVIVGTGGNISNNYAIKWSAAPASHVATMADLFFANTPAGFVDFTEPSNRRKFIFVNGGAQNLQPDGSGPFSVAPPVFLSVQGSDVPLDFTTNHGRGGAFNQSGPALTDGASDPPPVTVSTQSTSTVVPFSSVLGDYLTGNIYIFDPSTLTDNGQPRKWVRRWRGLPTETTSSITFCYLSIDMETGIQVPPGTYPVVMLRWSDDGGRTWSGNRIIPVGPTGETTWTVKFNRLGSTQRFSGSTRIFELSSTSPFKVSIISAEVLTK